MIETITVTRYRADDGRLYDTLEEATQRNAILELSRELDSSDISFRDTGPQEVAAWILDHYHITRRTS